MSITLKADIQDVVGPVQLCASYEGGCEAAVHAMHELYCDAIIQVVSTNAFNLLNHQVALRNVLHLCPSLAKIIINSNKSDV